MICVCKFTFVIVNSHLNMKNFHGDIKTVYKSFCLKGFRVYSKIEHLVCGSKYEQFLSLAISQDTSIIRSHSGRIQTTNNQFLIALFNLCVQANVTIYNSAIHFYYFSCLNTTASN